MTDLEPMAPHEAVELYLEAKRDDLADATLEGHSTRLAAFVQFCDEEDITNLNDLTGRILYRYRVWRRKGNGDGRDPVKKVTLVGQLATLRAFLRFAGDVGAVPQDLFDQVSLPTMSGSENVSDTTLDPDRIITILDYLETYKPYTRDHVTVLVGWRTGARMGGLRALDLRDVDLDGDHPRFDGPAIHFVHRPESGTPLKNQDLGTRWNRISQYTATVIENYIGGHRHDVTDDNGRAPLLTTEYGRPSRTTIRRTLYRVTRPCWYGEECPHDKDPETCDFTESRHASKCPSSRSPHDLRSGRVTYYRREDVPRRVVQDRLDASEDILDRHYDRRSAREQAEQRSEHLPDL
jgi:integrase